MNVYVQNSGCKMEKLIVIDGNSIASRAFYALPLLSNSAGLHTNAVYGFTTMLLRLIEEENRLIFSWLSTRAK